MRVSRVSLQNVEYLPPWGFERNADNTAVVDTGDAALHPLGILVFRQPGSIDVTEVAQGCSIQGTLFGRTLNIVSSLESCTHPSPVPVLGLPHPEVRPGPAACGRFPVLDQVLPRR